MLGFDVRFDVDGEPQQITTHHTNRGFRVHGTALNDMGHDGTVLQAQYFKSAASANSATPASNYDILQVLINIFKQIRAQGYLV